MKCVGLARSDRYLDTSITALEIQVEVATLTHRQVLAPDDLRSWTWWWWVCGRCTSRKVGASGLLGSVNHEDPFLTSG